MQGAGPRRPAMRKTIHTLQYRALLAQLRKARLEVGMTQKQLAELLEASQDEISRCETGVRRIDVIELKMWVEALGLRLPEFLDTLE